MQRRRQGGRPNARGGARGRGPGAGSPLFARPLVVAALVVVAGVGVGYLFATQMLFPSEVAISEFVPVPDLQGMTPSEAEGALAGSALRVGPVDSIHHPSVAEGRIVGQTPLPGQLSAPDGEIRLALSLGPESRPVPDVRRLRADRAVTVLEATGFAVVVDSVESDLPQGRVVSVDPEIGSDAILPAEVKLEVSLGPPLVEIPDLVGLEEDEALSVLDSLGLVVGEVETRFRFGAGSGEVLEQDPEAGSEVERGSAVGLVIGRSGVAFGNTGRVNP